MPAPQILTLSIEDVANIHKKISREAAASGDPIATMPINTSHSAVKDLGLLQSAVARQTAGIGGRLFYPTPYENAATLMFGIAKNHAFHDGNKRTALVAMLNHLDRNRLTLTNLTWQEIESLVLDLVVGTLPERAKLKHAVARTKDKSDRDLKALAEWIRLNSRSIERGERVMTYDEISQIIRRHGYEFGSPDGNYAPIVKLTERTTTNFLGKEKIVIERHHVGTVGYPGAKREIDVYGIKQIRKICHLTEEHGVDSAVFYDEEQALDSIINKHRKVLRSLADK